MSDMYIVNIMFHDVLNYLQRFMASHEEKALQRTANPGKKKEKQIWREGENSRELRKKGRNFPYMGTRVRARKAGRSIDRRIDLGPRMIVIRRSGRVTSGRGKIRRRTNETR